MSRLKPAHIICAGYYRRLSYYKRLLFRAIFAFVILLVFVPVAINCFIHLFCGLCFFENRQTITRAPNSCKYPSFVEADNINDESGIHFGEFFEYRKREFPSGIKLKPENSICNSCLTPKAPHCNGVGLWFN